MDKTELFEMLRQYLNVNVRVDNDGGDEDRIFVRITITFDGEAIAGDSDSEKVCCINKGE